MADTYCCMYNQVIKDKGDGRIVATDGVKRRILANEKTFRTICTAYDFKKCERPL